jgi:type I restriction enzyme, S subunit
MSVKKITLGDLCTIEKGATGISKAIPGEYPLVVTGEDRKSHNEFQFDDEAVIIPLVSGTGHGHASIKRIHFQTGRFALGSILCAVIPKDISRLNAEYLYYFLDLNRENELVSRMRGMANVTLPIKEIFKIEIPLPNLDQQIEFVRMYKSLGKKSNDLSLEFEHQLNLVKKLRQQLLQDAIQGKLVEQNPNNEPASILLQKIKGKKKQQMIEKKFRKEKELPFIKPEQIPFDIPENWAWCKLGEILNVKSSKRIFESDYRPTGTPFFRSMEIGLLGEGKEISKEIFISNEKYDEIKNSVGVPKAGDILIACIGGSIGNTWVVDDRKFYYKDGNLVLIESIDDVNTLFLLNYLKSKHFIDSAMERVSGSSYNALTIIKINSSLIPLPPLAEQHSIVEKLKQLMQTCDTLEASIKQSHHQNEQFLQQVLREALTEEAEPEIVK